MNRRTETIRIEGMSCTHCVRAVEEALKKVESLEVENVEIGLARVSYDPERTTRASVTQAIDEAGYTPHLEPEGA